jgi:U2-associated protein SR140
LEAAKVYAEFVASFQEPTSYKLGTSSFVKAGTLNPATSNIIKI